MRREHLLARLLRALSGKTQEQIGREIGAHTSLIAQFELGKVTPSPEHLERLAKAARITLPDAEEMLSQYERLQQPRRRRSRNDEDLLEGLMEEHREQTSADREHLLRLPLPDSSPRAEDRRRAEELFARLEGLHQETRLALVRMVEDFQTWALCERVCRAAEQEAARDVESAVAWAGLAEEVAARVRGTEEWRNRVRGYAAAHKARILQVAGDLEEAEAAFEQARLLGCSGSDPGGVLDSGGLLDAG